MSITHTDILLNAALPYLDDQTLLDASTPVDWIITPSVQARVASKYAERLPLGRSDFHRERRNAEDKARGRKGGNA